MTAATDTVTFCRICEPFCGLRATVEQGQLTKLRPDPDNLASRGFACARGLAMIDIQNDPDRVVYPLRKNAAGEFERVSWDQALEDISQSLLKLQKQYGADSIGWYMGNPTGGNFAHLLWTLNFIRALDTPHFYSVGSQDQNARMAASALLYGSPLVLPIPDLDNTEFLLMVGANPRVSQGSGISVPRVGEAIKQIERRGGRVVVVDPRCTPTAKAHEWLPIKPDSDALMLLAMLQVLFTENLIQPGPLKPHIRGLDGLRSLCAPFTPESTEQTTGIAADKLRQLARDLAAAKHAAVYGRLGSCVGSFGTLVSFLLDVMNIVTGNLDQRGGAVFGHSPLAVDEIVNSFGLASYARGRSRVGGLPEVFGQLPSSLMAKEIMTPGAGQLRALIVSAGNPILSSPDSDELEHALQQLELLVSIDLYVTETNRHADYILPATTFLEREDVPVFGLMEQIRPFIQKTNAVLAPRGEARQEWQIIEALAQAMGLSLIPGTVGRGLSRLGLSPRPQQLIDWLLRSGPQGDWFGLRRNGVSLKKLDDHPHGLMLEPVKAGVLKKKIAHADRRLRLDPPEIAFEVRRLRRVQGQPADLQYPLRLIGMRESRSHNSWMHNSVRLMRATRSVNAQLHPEDAGQLGLVDGETVKVSSKTGSIEIAIELTDGITKGTIAIPHGWGHRGGWQRANASSAPNINRLTSTQLTDIEKLAGMTRLSGVPVRIDRLSTEAAD